MFTVHDCFVERIGYSGVRYENSPSGARIYDSIFTDSGFEAPGQNKNHTGGVAINSSDNAEVHHCRFGGNFQNSGIDLSGNGLDNKGNEIFPGSRNTPVRANLRDNDLASDGITGTHSCGNPSTITCANNF